MDINIKKGILIVCLCAVCIGIFWSVGRLSRNSNRDTHCHMIHAADHAHAVSECLEKIDL